MHWGRLFDAENRERKNKKLMSRVRVWLRFQYYVRPFIQGQARGQAWQQGQAGFCSAGTGEMKIQFLHFIILFFILQIKSANQNFIKVDI